jgi:hypothetical protein
LIEGVDTTRIKELIRTTSPEGQKQHWPYLSVLDAARITKPPSKYL